MYLIKKKLHRKLSNTFTFTLHLQFHKKILAHQEFDGNNMSGKG